MVNPYTGEVLGVRDREKSVARWLHLLHTRFVAGDIGEKMVGGFSVAMLGLSLTGLVLWWPRKIFSIGAASSWKRKNFDLHNVLGFYSSLVMLFITLSGVLIAFEGYTDPLGAAAERRAGGAGAAINAGRWQDPHQRGRGDRDCRARAARRLCLERRHARRTEGGVPHPEEVSRRTARRPGAAAVYVDQFSGKVLLVENTRTAPLGTRILNLKRSAHTGDIFGAPTPGALLHRLAPHRPTGDRLASMWWNGLPIPPILRLLEVDEPAVDVDAGQADAQAVADVEPGPRRHQLPLDRRAATRTKVPLLDAPVTTESNVHRRATARPSPRPTSAPAARPCWRHPPAWCIVSPPAPARRGCRATDGRRAPPSPAAASPGPGNRRFGAVECE